MTSTISERIDPYRTFLVTEGALYASQMLLGSILEAITDEKKFSKDFLLSLPKILPLQLLYFTSEQIKIALQRFIANIESAFTNWRSLKLNLNNIIGQKVLTCGFPREVRELLNLEEQLNIKCYIPSSFNSSERRYLIRQINDYLGKSEHNVTTIQQFSREDIDWADAIIVTTYGIVEAANFPVAYLPKWIVDNVISKIRLYNPNAHLYLVYHSKLQFWEIDSIATPYTLMGSPIVTSFFKGFIMDIGFVPTDTLWPQHRRV